MTKAERAKLSREVAERIFDALLDGGPVVVDEPTGSSQTRQTMRSEWHDFIRKTRAKFLDEFGYVEPTRIEGLLGRNFSDASRRLAFLIQTGGIVQTVPVVGTDRHLYKVAWPATDESQKIWYSSRVEAVEEAIKERGWKWAGDA